jgi:hypothetical protein
LEQYFLKLPVLKVKVISVLKVVVVEAIVVVVGGAVVVVVGGGDSPARSLSSGQLTVL